MGLTIIPELPGFASSPDTRRTLAMPGKAAKVTVTERQHEILIALRNATTAPSHLRQRAAVILLAFDGLRNEVIAARIGLGRSQVGRWRRRWAKAWPALID